MGKTFSKVNEDDPEDTGVLERRLGREEHNQAAEGGNEGESEQIHDQRPVTFHITGPDDRLHTHDGV
jgi:hypothetical protein